MIRGHIDEQNSIIVDVTVSGMRGSVVLPAHLDTEFSEDLSLPTSIAVTIGLDLIDEIQVELGDGRIVQQLSFLGVANLGEGPREVEILLSEADVALIGRTWLHGRVLYAHYATGEVVIQDAPHSEV